MKTKNSYLTGCLALLIALSSCTKMNDTQEKYLDWGEKIYAAKIDSVFALSGYQRQVIDIYYSAPRIDHGIIVYNLNQDTVVFELPEDGSRHFSDQQSGRSRIQLYDLHFRQRWQQIFADRNQR